MNETIGVALVGFGYWGANLARNLAAVPSIELIGIVDQSADQLTVARASYPSIDLWSSVEGPLNDSRVSAVVIAAPAAQHEALATLCLESGRHVLVEKPLALTPEGAASVARLADRQGLIAMVGHTFLYSPPVWRLKEDVDAGRLGEIQYLYSQRLSLGRIRRDCNALWNFAPHDVSIMLHLLGEVPNQVSGTSIAMIDPSIADVFFAKLQFPSGVSAHLHVSWLDPRKTRLMTIVGDERMAIYDDVSVDQKIQIVDAGVARSNTFGTYESLGDFQWRTRAGDILIPKIALSEPLRNEMQDFADACRDGRPAKADAWSGVDVVSVLSAIDESARLAGSPVTLG